MATKATTIKDPVCGMDVDKSDCVQAKHAGKEYCFCGEECRDQFMDNPEKFIGGAAKKSAKK